MRRWLLLGLAASAVLTAAGTLDEARSQLLAGNTDAAIETLRGVLAKDPSAIEPAVLLSETLLATERFDEASEAAEQARARHPSEAVFERLLGDICYREGRIFEADKHYKAAVKTDPRNARAIYGESQVFEASSLRKRAFEVLRVAHAIDAQDALIAAAFFSVDHLSPMAVSRLERELARQQAMPEGKSDASLDRGLKLWIAEGKALDGKPAFEAAAAGQSYRIPLGHLIDGRRLTGISLPIRINEAKADFRFDTGAGGIVVGSRFAERAGIERLGETQISGVGNGPPVKGWVGYAPLIHIGGLELKNCIVAVPEKGSVDESGGLIGSDILKQFLIKINFDSKSLDLDPLPGPAWDGRTLVDRYEGPELAGFSQMLIIHHYLLIPTLLSETTKAEQTPALFLLDTGALLNMISTILAPDITKVRDSANQVRGISGKVRMVYSADKVVVQFAHFRQQMHDLTSFDLRGFSRGAGAEIGGIMGLPLIGMFRSVTLDYRDGRVRFDYKP